MRKSRTSPRAQWPPIQFGYNPHPWWKFEHLRRYHPILMPICRRRYPMSADTSPPADIEAMARWLVRWGLSSGRPASELRRRLEALASTPVEKIDPGVAPGPAPGTIARLPAEWEPTEAVLMAWPVLYPGLWGFHRDVLQALAPVARVDVLIPSAIYAPAILDHLGHGGEGHPRIRFLVTAFDDIWVRDYGPLTGFDEAGERVMVDAIFDPPPTMPFANDDAFTARYAAHEGVPSRHLPLHLEGGNIFSDGRGTIITTEGLFARNPLLPRDEVRRQLLDGLGAERLLALPTLHLEDTGHIDVFVKLAAPETILITAARSVFNRQRLLAASGVLAGTQAAGGGSFRVLTLPNVPNYRNWGIVRVSPNYANSLIVNGRVLVPTYRDPPRDGAALAVYRQAMPDYEVIGVDARVAVNSGGTIHCLTMQIPARAAMGG